MWRRSNSSDRMDGRRRRAGGGQILLIAEATDDDGGREIAPELDLPVQEQRRRNRRRSQRSDIDDSGDAPADQSLETIRRAAALDLGDPDTLPEF